MRNNYESRMIIQGTIASLGLTALIFYPTKDYLSAEIRRDFNPEVQFQIRKESLEPELYTPLGKITTAIGLVATLFSLTKKEKK